MVVVARFGEGPGLRDELAAELNRRAAEEQEEERGGEDAVRGMRDYALMIPESKSGDLDLEQFPFQAEPLYSDEIAAAEEVVIMKSTQVGVSTGVWRWAMRQADQYGETVIYFFPTEVHVREFNDTRIDTAIAISEYLQRRIPEGYVHQKGLKQIGAGWLSLRGVQSRNAVQSVDADALVFDEYDECDQTNLEHAERRISGAMAAGRTPRIRRVGRPSVPGYGIDAEFQESDQRVWIVECPKCGERQTVEFENLRWRTELGGKKVMRPGRDEYEVRKDVKDAWRACRECDASLEPGPRARKGPIHAGTWEAQRKAPGRSPGFHISRLIVPRTNLKAVVVASRGTKIHERELFHNADLGIAWAAEDAYLTDEQIDRACALGGEMLDEYRGRRVVTAGVDVASKRDLSIRISEHLDGTRKAIYLGEPTDFEEVRDLIQRFRVHVAVVDSMPERRHVKALVQEFRGRVFSCGYDLRPDSDAVRFDPAKGHIQVNRTEAIDAMMDSIRELTNRPLKVPPPRYREQLKSLKRRIVEDTKGRPRKEYVKTGSVGDDYAHAEVYDVVASEMVRILQRAEQAEQEAERVVEEEDLGIAPVRMGWGSTEYDPGFGGRSDY